jgi:hypothetical protein
VDADAVNDCASRSGAPSAAQQINGVSASHEPPENLMEMKLCPARLWVLTILPVENEDSH